MSALDFDSENPLIIGFKMSADDADGPGACNGFLRRYIIALQRLWTQQRVKVDLAAFEEDSGFLVVPFPLIGAAIPDAFIIAHLAIVERAGEDTLWRLHFRSNPGFIALSLEDRITMADLQRDALALMTRFDGVEQINSICPQRAA